MTDQREGEDDGGVLDVLLRGAANLRSPETVPPDDTALVAYLTGTVSPADAAHIERGLVTFAPARRRLRDVAVRLDALQAAPWSEGIREMDGVALLWRTMVESRLSASSGARERWFSQGWVAIRAGVTTGFAEAQAAWAAFQSFADGWDRARRAPRLALVRGDSSPDSDVAGLPAGIAVTTEAEVRPNGDLFVRIRVRDGVGQSSPALDGRNASLSLAAGGEGNAWPLAQTLVSMSEASWSLPGAASVLNLKPGPMSSGDLLVSFDVPSLEVAAPETVLLAAYGDDEGFVRVDLLETPVRDAGRLRVVVGLPPLTRSLHAARLLTLSVAVAPGLYQQLGTWPAWEWGDAPRTLDVACPGADGVLDPALLRVDFRDAGLVTREGSES